MLYLAIGIGLCVTIGIVFLCGLGHAAKRGDRKLQRYNEARGRYYPGTTFPMTNGGDDE
jgi:hypothetical protein